MAEALFLVARPSHLLPGTGQIGNGTWEQNLLAIGLNMVLLPQHLSASPLMLVQLVLGNRKKERHDAPMQTSANWGLSDLLQGSIPGHCGPSSLTKEGTSMLVWL